jgi:hypothetical protein
LLGLRESFAGGANLGTGRDKIKARVRAFIRLLALDHGPTTGRFSTEPYL